MIRTAVSVSQRPSDFGSFQPCLTTCMREGKPWTRRQSQLAGLLRKIETRNSPDRFTRPWSSKCQATASKSRNSQFLFWFDLAGAHARTFEFSIIFYSVKGINYNHTRSRAKKLQLEDSSCSSQPTNEGTYEQASERTAEAGAHWQT